jgi:hypothetical protein
MKRNFIKNIIFSRTPLNSCYRFGDKFQIYPVNLENAPSSSHGAHFPMIIEFYFDDSEIKEVKEFSTKSVNQTLAELTAQTNKLIQITNLISTISNYRLFFYRHPEIMWSVPIPEEITDEIKEEFNKTSSSPSMPIFTYENIGKDLHITKLSNPDFPKIELLPQKLYYFYEPLEDKKKNINFPNTADLIFENYFKLDYKELKIINSAMHQFCNGLDLFKNMKSLSFFSIVSSIETLVNLEFKDEKIEFECSDCKTIKESKRHCQKCGRPSWGIAAKFREFLFKYVSNKKEAKKLYNQIYNIRSKITHTEYLLNGDNFSDWEFNNKTEEISMLHLTAMQIARRSFANWLLSKSE